MSLPRWCTVEKKVSTEERLPSVLKAWAAEYTPPPHSRNRLLRVAKHLAPGDYNSERQVVNFRPFVPADWSQFGFAWDSAQLFKFGLNWTNFKA